MQIDSTKQVLFQDVAISKLTQCLRKWKRGRGILIHGPPGIGKTVSVHALARERSWDLIEINASDKRSAQAIEALLGTTITQHSLFNTGKIILIDELDGLTRVDRGAAATIAGLIKKSAFPIVLITKNAWDYKVAPIRQSSDLIEFKKIPAFQLQQFLIEHCKKNNQFVKFEIIQKIASKGDLRSALIDLDTFTEDSERERGEHVFESLRKVFQSASLDIALRALKSSNLKKEELKSWISENIPQEFPNPKNMAKAYDLISKADMYKNQRHFNEYLAAIATLKKAPTNKFMRYMPKRTRWPKKSEPIGHKSIRKTIWNSIKVDSI